MYEYKELAKKEDLDKKQDELVSGSNIKTINNQSILGSGNIDVAPVVQSTGTSTTSVMSQNATTTELNTVRNIAQGKNSSYVTGLDFMPELETDEDEIEITQLILIGGDEVPISQLKVGDNIYVQELNVSDWWVKVDDGQTSGNYVVLSKLETAKVDLTNYQTKSDNTLATTTKTVVGAINELNSGKLNATKSALVNLGAMVTPGESLSSRKIVGLSKSGIQSTMEIGSGLQVDENTYYPTINIVGVQEQNANEVFTQWVGSQSEYDAITTKDENRIYFIKG